MGTNHICQFYSNWYLETARYTYICRSDFLAKGGEMGVGKTGVDKTGVGKMGTSQKKN